VTNEKNVMLNMSLHNHFLSCSFENTSQSIFYKRELLCRTISGLPVFVITIGSDSRNYRKRPVIAITSRVHAGETPGSFVFQGIYEYLMSNESYSLRKNYTFVLIPCLNPDGVVCGNYRSSLSGSDLNRQWLYPEEEIHPEIYFTKTLY
jgi:murein tripeptide amidase MpaA